MWLPQSRTHQTLAGSDPTCPQLETHVFHRAEQPRRRAGVTPHVADVLVFRRQGSGGTGDALQGRDDPDARRLHRMLALPRRGVGPELQSLVNHAQVVLVMEKSRVGADFRIDADPEIHIPVECRRLWKYRIEHSRRGGRRRDGGARHR